MKDVTSYSAGILFSMVIHVAVVAALLINWAAESKKVMVQPQYIEAKLVELAPKKKPVAKKPPKPKVDAAQEKARARQAPCRRTERKPKPNAGNPQRKTEEESARKKEQSASAKQRAAQTY